MGIKKVLGVGASIIAGAAIALGVYSEIDRHDKINRLEIEFERAGYKTWRCEDYRNLFRHALCVEQLNYSYPMNPDRFYYVGRLTKDGFGLRFLLHVDDKRAAEIAQREVPVSRHASE